jgi:ribosomal protein S18 acetylase RimI-like enzyme
MTMKGSFQTIKNFHKTVEAAQQVSSATMEKRNTWQIYWIGVDIPFRRKGYATMLINFILSRLKQEESMGCMAVVFNEELGRSLIY